MLRELKSQDPSIEVRFWCDNTFGRQAKSIVGYYDPEVRVDTIISGKLRRYHHLTFLQHLTIPSVLWPNLRDGVLVVAGVVQSVSKLLIWRPDVVFTKGGYVCLPVGWAARFLRIPLVIHDSDAHPGLTNRLLAKHADIIATGAPLEYYSYPKERSYYVGIPIGEEFKPFSQEEQRHAKRLLGVSLDKPLIVITGGGLGAKLLNDAVVLHLDALMELGTVILVSGSAQYDELHAITPSGDSRFQLHAFISNGMAQLLGAADVVVTRAGATTILELAGLAKPTILVPNGRLTGGHQLKNAKVYEDKKAVLVIDDNKFAEPSDASLVTAVKTVLGDSKLQESLSAAIRTFAKPNAAKDVAKLIIQAIKKQ